MACAIVFQEAGFSAFARDLVGATPVNIARARDFVERQTPKGEGYPFSALTAATRLNPDAIWLISDGDLGDVKATLDEVLRIHAGSRARINTAFFGDVEERGPAWLMRSIAERTGGRAINENGEDLRELPPPPPPPPLPPARERPTGPSIFRER